MTVRQYALNLFYGKRLVEILELQELPTLAVSQQI